VKHKTRTLAGLLLALVLFFSLPVMLSAATPGAHSSTASIVMLIVSGLALVGGTTVFYTYPTGPYDETGVTTFNTTVPPTSSQAGVFASLSIKFQMADGETSCTFTHNWGLSNTATNRFFPIPLINALASGTAGGNSFAIAYGTQTLVVSKGGTAGTGGTFSCLLLKPHSIMR